MSNFDVLSLPAPWAEVVVNTLTLLFVTFWFAGPTLFLYLPIKWVQKHGEEKIFKPLDKIRIGILNNLFHLEAYWRTTGPKATFVLGLINYYILIWFNIPVRQYNLRYLSHPYHNKLRPFLKVLNVIIVLIELDIKSLVYDDLNRDAIIVNVRHKKHQKRKVRMLQKALIRVEEDKQIVFSIISDTHFKVIWVS